MKKNIIVILVFAMALLAVSVQAQSKFSTGISAEKDQIYSNESASFILEVFSTSNNIETFSVYTDVEWILTTDPASDKNLKVYPGSQKKTRLLIKPSSVANILPGAYTVRVYLKNQDTEEVISNDVIIHVRGESDYAGTYLPSLRAEIRMDQKIDPRKDFQITVLVENQNPLFIEEVDLRVVSDLFNLYDNFSLKGLGKYEKTFDVKLDNLQPPYSDSVKVNVQTFKNSRLYEFNSMPLSYQVISYSNVRENMSKEKFLFKSTYTYELFNEGNVEASYEFKIPRKILKAPFNTFDLQPTIKKIGGKKYYVWDLNIGVEGTYVIHEKVNYRYLIVTLLIIIILALLYLIFRSPLLIKKSMVVTSAKHGGIASITVQIDVKNRSPNKYNELEIKDKVPNIFILEKEFDIGTLHPFQILKHERKGTIVKWKLDTIDPFEERIITYKLNSKLNIVGKFALPSAALTFLDKNKTKIIHSNRVMMQHQQ